ncbi:MAG TPA: toll/interleukin-1 receptor domain-containing protein [Ktedonobacterales bacterium]
MLERRKMILRLLYAERERSPIHTLTVDHFMAALSTTRDDTWNDLEHLKQSGFLSISDRLIGGRVFYTFELTPHGVDFVENALFASAAFRPTDALVSSANAPLGLFVSHSGVDNAFCDRMVSHLMDARPSLNIFYDNTSLLGGDNWVKRIPREVLGHPVFVVVLSPSAVESSWVREETQLALREAITNTQRRIIPVLHVPCDVNHLSPLLPSIQVIDCTLERESAGFALLVKAVLA